MSAPTTHTCYLCHEEIEVGSRNWFSASGLACHLVCPRLDPSGAELRRALDQQLELRRRASLR